MFPSESVRSGGSTERVVEISFPPKLFACTFGGCFISIVQGWWSMQLIGVWYSETGVVAVRCMARHSYCELPCISAICLFPILIYVLHLCWKCMDCCEKRTEHCSLQQLHVHDKLWMVIFNCGCARMFYHVQETIRKAQQSPSAAVSLACH